MKIEIEPGEQFTVATEHADRILKASVHFALVERRHAIYRPEDSEPPIREAREALLEACRETFRGCP